MTVETTQLYHEVAGSGPPVVFIHEGICDRRMWDPQWQTFPQTHTCVRLDLRGFGESPLAPGPFAHAPTVIDLLERLDLGTTALVGASLGGRVALEVALERPELVSALVLVGPGLPDLEPTEETRAGWAEEEAALERGDIDAAVEVNLRMWVDGPHRAPDDVDPAVRAQVGEMQRRALELYAGAGEAEEELFVPDLRDRLPDIAAPTLLIVGAQDRPEIHTAADVIEERVPRVRRADIAGTAHVPNMERPSEFDELVLPFLAEHR